MPVQRQEKRSTFFTFDRQNNLFLYYCIFLGKKKKKGLYYPVANDHVITYSHGLNPIKNQPTTNV